MKKIKTLICVLIICFGISLNVGAQQKENNKEVNPSDTFPVPKEHKDLLFYVQRTHNKNTIVYELNYNKDSTLNENQPVKMYWIRYSDKGEIAPLSNIQRKYAYGLNVVMTDTVRKIFKLNFVSYKKRDIYLIKSPTDSSYHAFININGKMSFFNKAFAKIDGGTFWVPHVTYVEIQGKEISTGKKVSEKIIP